MISLQQIAQSLGGMRPTATTSGTPLGSPPTGAYTVQVDPLTGRSLPPPGSQAPSFSLLDGITGGITGGTTGGTTTPPPFSPPTGPFLPDGFPNPYAGYNPALDPGAFAVPGWRQTQNQAPNTSTPWDFRGTDYAPPPPPEYGLLPPPRSLISPWDTAPAQRLNTYTNVYGQQFTTPQQINLSRFSSNPSGNLPLYMNQDIANILATALGY